MGTLAFWYRLQESLLTSVSETLGKAAQLRVFFAHHLLVSAIPHVKMYVLAVYSDSRDYRDQNRF